MIEAIAESKSVQFTGKIAFLVGLFGSAVNLISRMEIIQPIILTISGILGIIFVIYKIIHIRIEVIERNEARIAEGKKPISWKFFNYGKRKNKSQKDSE